jgi:N-acetylglutamate synthase-like GNAT family acetyltransferase
VDGLRKSGAASLMLGTCKALPEHMQEDIREITSLQTEEPERRKSHATILLHQVCYEADKKQKVLMLMPDSVGEMSNKQLMKFYEKFGFKKIQDNPVLMARPHGRR